MALRTRSTRVANQDRHRFSLTKALRRNSHPLPSEPATDDIPNPAAALAATAAADFAFANSTTLYVTYTAELRSDEDLYMFSIDKCYTTPEQANSRVRLLGESNFSLRRYRSEKMSTMLADVEEGDVHAKVDDLKMVTWKRIGPGNKPRFMASTKKIVMAGRIPCTGDEDLPVEDGGPNDVSSLFVAFSHLEMPGHVWVVAMYLPKWIWDELAELARTPGSEDCRPASDVHGVSLQEVMNDLNANDDKVRPKITWRMVSVHRTSFVAGVRAKQIWMQLFYPVVGRSTKDHEHYGFARFALKPAYGPSGNKIEYTGCDVGPQIRIERVKVTGITDKPEYYVPPPLKMQLKAKVKGNAELQKESADLRKGIKGSEEGKTDKILVAPPLKCVNGQVISTAQGKRTSYIEDLQDSIDEALQPSFSYQDIPLSFKLKQRNLERWGELEDQRFGGSVNLEEQEEKFVEKDIYHGFMHNNHDSQNGKRPAKLRSKAYNKAQLRMQNAVEEQGFLADVGGSAVARGELVTTIEGGDGRKSVSRAGGREGLAGEVLRPGGSVRGKDGQQLKTGSLRREGWGSQPPERRKKRVSFAGL
ncbi:hypothetical protein LTR86_010294 [Recurvomyces mirabilis]|nr:hypothetical protein LTR86_010294 [Recurvomyces mirabilis]